MTTIERKRAYRTFCAAHPELPLFFQPWWLDLVCVEGKWNVCLSRDKGGNVWGVLPYYVKKHHGFPVITMPMLSPYLGPWLVYPEGKKDRFSFEKRVMDELIEQLPKVAFFRQDFALNTQNGLPYYWQGFQVEVVYTFLIKHDKTPASVRAACKPDVRNKIRKAKQQLQITESNDLQLLLTLLQQTFTRQGLEPFYDLPFLENLDRELVARKRRKLLFAQDQEGRPHAGIYLVEDQHTVYNLLLGADTQLRSSGAVQYLLFQGIQWAAKQHKNFDFEGSMLPGVAPIFNGFGAEQVSYLRVSRGRNQLFDLLKVLFAKW